MYNFIQYSKYLKSKEWQDFRKLYFSVYPKRCIICHTSAGKIQLHHKQYNNYRSKKLSDYAPLCESHHKDLTQKWRANKMGMDLRKFTDFYIKVSRRNK